MYMTYGSILRINLMRYNNFVMIGMLHKIITYYKDLFGNEGTKYAALTPDFWIGGEVVLSP